MLKNNISHGRVSVRALKHVWKGTLNSVHEAVYYKRSYCLLIMFNACVPCSLCEFAPYLHLQGEKNHCRHAPEFYNWSQTSVICCGLLWNRTFSFVCFGVCLFPRSLQHKCNCSCCSMQCCHPLTCQNKFTYWFLHVNVCDRSCQNVFTAVLLQSFIGLFLIKQSK